MLISADSSALQMVASGCRPSGSLITNRSLSVTIILPWWKISSARSGSLRTMRMMAQSAESTTVSETMRTSVTSNRRTTSMRAPIRLARKTLNWRTLGQSRPRAVSKSTPDPSPKLIPISELGGWSISDRGGRHKQLAGSSTGLLPPGDEHPIQHGLDLERLHLWPQRENAGRDAREVGRGPTGRRLAGERTEVPAAVGLELDRVAQLVRELERVVEY